MTPKLDVGATLSRVFDLYREQAGVLLPAAALIYLIPAVAAAIVGGNAAAVGLAFVVSVVGVIAGFWYQGVAVEAVRDIEEDGRRDFSVGDLFRSAAPYVGTLLATGFLAGIGIAAGLVLLIVPGLILLTWWAVIAPVVVLERAGILQAFGRSRELVRGNGWQVFGVIVLLAIVQALVAGVFRGLALAISDGRISEAIGSYAGNIIIAPLSGIAATVVYLRLRQLRGEPPLGGAQTRDPITGEPAVPGGFAPPVSPTPTPAPSPDPGPGPAGPPSGGAPLPGEEHRGWEPPVAPGGPDPAPGRPTEPDDPAERP